MNSVLNHSWTSCLVYHTLQSIDIKLSWNVIKLLLLSLQNIVIAGTEHRNSEINNFPS